MTPTYYKLLDIENMRWRAVHLIKHIYDTEWVPFLEKAKQVKKWWGYAYWINPNQKIIMHCNEGIEYHIISPLSEEDIFTIPDKELPLLLDTTHPKALQALKDRLSGSTKQLPYNQDLITRYHREITRSSRVYLIQEHCNKLISNYVCRKCYEKYPNDLKYDNNFIVTLSLNNRDYICMIDKRHSNIIIIHPPEKTMRRISQSELLEDEASYPDIHGFKSWA